MQETENSVIFIVYLIIRIQGIGRVRRMYAQLDPMKQIVGELKKDRDSAMKKISGVEKDLSGLITKFKVCKLFSSWAHRCYKVSTIEQMVGNVHCFHTLFPSNLAF